jgi:hypothetical protein
VNLVSPVLFIIVEGDDDERFFKEIVSPLLLQSFSVVQIWKCAEQKNEKTENFLSSASQIGEYLYVEDIDDAPCVSFKKKAILKKFSQIETKRIIVVIKEIESWYLAGLDRECCAKLGIGKYLPNTNLVNKEQFNKLIPRKTSRIELMRKIVEKYDINLGVRRNNSFAYFYRRLIKCCQSET